MPNSLPQQGSLQAQALQQLIGQDGSIEALQTSITQLSEQVAALRAQRDILSSQIRRMPASEARVGLDAQRAQLDGQLVQAEMKLEAAKAQLASRLGVSTGLIGPTGRIIVQPPYYPRQGVDPDMVVGLSFTLAIAVGLPLAIAYARRVWRGTPKNVRVAPDESNVRLERLEHAVDAIAIEIERVAEGQRFVTKVLAERPATTAPAPERAESALGEAKPFLALGAGPMEPIRAAERQTVKQSITPH
jgi:hypothetical protein